MDDRKVPTVGRYRNLQKDYGWRRFFSLSHIILDVLILRMGGSRFQLPWRNWLGIDRTAVELFPRSGAKCGVQTEGCRGGEQRRRGSTRRALCGKCNERRMPCYAQMYASLLSTSCTHQLLWTHLSAEKLSFAPETRTRVSATASNSTNPVIRALEPRSTRRMDTCGSRKQIQLRYTSQLEIRKKYLRIFEAFHEFRTWLHGIVIFSFTTGAIRTESFSIIVMLIATALSRFSQSFSFYRHREFGSTVVYPASAFHTC